MQGKEISEEVAVGEDLKEKTSEVIVHSSQVHQPMPPADITMTQVLAMLVQKGGDVEVIKTMVALKKELDADEAKKKYYAAFAKAQNEMQPVVARSHNKHTGSKYAAIEAINTDITPIVSKHGFSTTFNQGVSEKEGFIRILGTLSHKNGHFEPYHIDLPIDDKGSGGKSNKTVVQGTGSTFQYGRRYLKLMMFDIAVKGEDNDGNAVQEDNSISSDQLIDLVGLIDGDKNLLDKICAAYGIEFLKELNSDDFQNCRNRIVKRKTDK